MNSTSNRIFYNNNNNMNREMNEGEEFGKDKESYDRFRNDM